MAHAKSKNYAFDAVPCSRWRPYSSHGGTANHNKLFPQRVQDPTPAALAPKKKVQSAQEKIEHCEGWSKWRKIG